MDQSCDSRSLTTNNIKLSDLTESEKQFLGLERCGGSARSYVDLGMLAQKYEDAHGHMPRNAAELALEGKSPEVMIRNYPILVNPLTGKLYGSLHETHGPLAVNLSSSTQQNFLWRLLHKSRTSRHPVWHLITMRENGHDVLLDEKFEVNY